jgi:hypothetical protein
MREAEASRSVHQWRQTADNRFTDKMPAAGGRHYGPRAMGGGTSEKAATPLDSARWQQGTSGKVATPLDSVRWQLGTQVEECGVELGIVSRAQRGYGDSGGWLLLTMFCHHRIYSFAVCAD